MAGRLHCMARITAPNRILNIEIASESYANERQRRRTKSRIRRSATHTSAYKKSDGKRKIRQCTFHHQSPVIGCQPKRVLWIIFFGCPPDYRSKVLSAVPFSSWPSEVDKLIACRSRASSRDDHERGVPGGRECSRRG